MNAVKPTPFALAALGPVVVVAGDLVAAAIVGTPDWSTRWMLAQVLASVAASVAVFALSEVREAPSPTRAPPIPSSRAHLSHPGTVAGGEIPAWISGDGRGDARTREALQAHLATRLAAPIGDGDPFGPGPQAAVRLAFAVLASHASETDGEAWGDLAARGQYDEALARFVEGRDMGGACGALDACRGRHAFWETAVMAAFDPNGPRHMGGCGYAVGFLATSRPDLWAALPVEAPIPGHRVRPAVGYVPHWATGSSYHPDVEVWREGAAIASHYVAELDAGKALPVPSVEDAVSLLHDHGIPEDLIDP